MIHFETEIRIRRPAREVFGFIADFENNPRWQSGMVEARWTSRPPLRVGSTYEQRARFLGRDIVTAFRVVSYEPGRSVTIESESGPFPIRVTRTVADDDGRATVRAVVAGDASGFFRIAEPLLRLLVRRSVRRDYRRLKDLLESRSSGVDGGGGPTRAVRVESTTREDAGGAS